MSENKIYLDMPGQLRQVLDDSGLTIDDVLRREGVDLPLLIQREELPALIEGERERDIGFSISPSDIALLTVSLSAAVSMVILALSKFLKDREHAPRVIETYTEKTLTDADGKVRQLLVREKQLAQPDTTLNATELETRLGLKDGAVVRFRTEDIPDR